MDHAATVRTILTGSPTRRRVLDCVGALGLPDCWVGAGFVRNAVWDHLHGREPSGPTTDVDVVWFDPQRASPQEDATCEAVLRERMPGLDWSVRNQARMHGRNGDPPYGSTQAAMCCWPETATAVAARLEASGACEIAAPFGLDDLFNMIVRPTPRFDTARHVILRRAREKNWLAHWPGLRLAQELERAGP